MLVVIPVLDKIDVTLKRALTLDTGPLPFTAILMTDGDANGVADLAKALFKSVLIQPVSPVKAELSPVKRANRFWQITAQQMAKQSEPWFWWTPGALPLKARWLTRLHNEYQTRGKPFMGVTGRNYVVAGGQPQPGRYIDSVAIYPANALHYSDRAMLAAEAPFNLAAGKAFFNAAHLTDLIANEPSRIADAVLSVPMPSHVNVDQWLGKKEDLPAVEPVAPDVVYASEDQKIHVPSIKRQTEWEVGFYRFPDEGRVKGWLVEYFNPTLCHWRGHWRLITRRRSEQTRPAKNMLMMWTLIDNTPVDPRPIHIPARYPNENWEDPRATILSGGQCLLSWCNFNHRSYAHQAYGMLNDKLTVFPRHLAYGRNGDRLISGRGPEKNWGWFEHDGEVWCSYLLCPNHEVIQVRNNRVTARHMTPSVDIQKLWKWGEIRGGAPPYRVGDHYYCWMHSRLPWRLERGYWFNRYYMGVVEFEAKPPFTVTRVSEKPILTGSADDVRNHGAPLCVFPCGSSLTDGLWHVVLGVNDCKCAWIKAPHEELLQTLVDPRIDKIRQTVYQDSSCEVLSPNPTG